MVGLRFSLTPRLRVTLLLAPAILMACILLGHWALLSIGVGAPKYAEIDLKALGNFPCDEEGGCTQDIPRRWRDLNGRRVEVTGFMGFPVAGAGVQKYRLVYNVSSPSGFNRPLIQERIDATAPMSMSVFSPYDCVRVSGVLHVGVQRDPSGNASVFRMDVESVAAWRDDAPASLRGRAPTVNLWVGLFISYLFLVSIIMVKHWPWRDIQSRRAASGLSIVRLRTARKQRSMSRMRRPDLRSAHHGLCH